MIIITPGFANLLTEIGGPPKINPENGIPEFGFFKEFLRIAAPVVGAVLGGPVGAFAASTIANKATGKSWGDSLKQGGLSAGLAFAAPYAMNALGFSGVGGAGGAGAGAGGFGGFGNVFSSFGGGAGNSFPASSIGRMLPASAYGNGAGSAGAAAGATQGFGGQLSGFLGNMGGLGKILPIAAQGLMAAKGAREEQKALREHDEMQKRDLEELRRRSGIDIPLRPVKPLNRELAPEYTEEDRKLGRTPSFYKPYDMTVQYMKEGGAIRGFGKGQQDNISKNIPENSYIIDASTVSDLGDGSSDAGYHELDSFFSKLPSQKMHKKKGGSIKAKVSNGEYEVSPDKVTALGEGSNERGAHFLEQLVNEIRQNKRSSGKKLPPKAKAIGGYLQNLRMA